jgi:hypothetical protein
MSTPEHPHLLRRELERGAGGQYVPARFAQMRCDGAMARCALPPERAPRIVVPARPFLPWGPQPLRMWTTLHYCERHKHECTVETALGDRDKAQLEQIAGRKWSQEYRPDFDMARIEWILVTTPEYRKFLEKIELGIVHSRQGVPVL